MKKKSVAKKQSKAVAIRATPQAPKTMMQMVADAARDKSVDVAKMRELLALLKEEQARAVLDPLILSVQKACPRIVADSTNTHTKSRYAKLEKVSGQLEPVLREHGLGITWSTADSPLPNHYRVVGDLIHGPTGAERRYFLDAPSDAKGPQGGGNKSEVQGVGSTVSYLRRYIKIMMFDITIVGEDNDGSGPTITGDQVNDLIHLAGTAEVSKEKVCAFAKVEELADIPASKYREVCIAVKAFAAGKANAGKKATAA
jgi:hypothetical protein